MRSIKAESETQARGREAQGQAEEARMTELHNQTPTMPSLGLSVCRLGSEAPVSLRLSGIPRSQSVRIDLDATTCSIRINKLWCELPICVAVEAVSASLVPASASMALPVPTVSGSPTNLAMSATKA